MFYLTNDPNHIADDVELLVRAIYSNPADVANYGALQDLIEEKYPGIETARSSDKHALHPPYDLVDIYSALKHFRGREPSQYYFITKFRRRYGAWLDRKYYDAATKSRNAELLEILQPLLHRYVYLDEKRHLIDTAFNYSTHVEYGTRWVRVFAISPRNLRYCRPLYAYRCISGYIRNGFYDLGDIVWLNAPDTHEAPSFGSFIPHVNSLRVGNLFTEKNFGRLIPQILAKFYFRGKVPKHLLNKVPKN